MTLKNLLQVDTNFKIKSNIEKEDIKFYNVLDKPFKVYGVFMENGKFRRIHENIAKTISEGVHFLHANTAGGRVRFKTNSSYIAILAKMENITRMPHFSFTGSAGFDMYERTGQTQSYIATFVPPDDMKDGYESLIELGDKKWREITINFPSYSDVKELYIGLSNNAKVDFALPYTNEKPIVYYGSSITQGGCASRPGNSYQNIISRKLNCDYINLGFSGSAKAEVEIAEYIKNLNMSIFVYDYDYNAPNIEHLANTHEKMFKIIRESNQDLPIIIMSRPKYNLTKNEKKRFEIISTTYENAILKEDKNVYLVSGKQLMRDCKDEGTVDRCHPTDFGFASMAKALEKVIKPIIK